MIVHVSHASSLLIMKLLIVQVATLKCWPHITFNVLFIVSKQILLVFDIEHIILNILPVISVLMVISVLHLTSDVIICRRCTNFSTRSLLTPFSCYLTFGLSALHMSLWVRNSYLMKHYGNILTEATNWWWRLNRWWERIHAIIRRNRRREKEKREVKKNWEEDEGKQWCVWLQHLIVLLRAGVLIVMSTTLY